MRLRLLLRSLCKFSLPTPNRESGLYGRLPPTVDIHSHLLCYTSLRSTAETWLPVRKWVCSKKAPRAHHPVSRMRVCLDATHHSIPAPPYWAVPLPGLDIRAGCLHGRLIGAFLVHIPVCTNHFSSPFLLFYTVAYILRCAQLKAP